MSQETAQRVNSICEHQWHNCLHNKAINADDLLKIVQERMYKQPVKDYVDEWIAKFSERNGMYRLFSKGGQLKAKLNEN